jgi:Predicted exonuclease of the beta-lactamase fold involved in RNA processing
MTSKRKASAMGTAVDDEPVDPSDELAFYCLGGGNEVGRSCHILEYKGKTVMVSLNLEQGMNSQTLTPLASVA